MHSNRWQVHAAAGAAPDKRFLPSPSPWPSRGKEAAEEEEKVDWRSALRLRLAAFFSAAAAPSAARRASAFSAFSRRSCSVCCVLNCPGDSAPEEGGEEVTRVSLY